MGRGNVCVTGLCEGLCYIDNEYTVWYRRTDSAETDDCEDEKLLCDLDYADLCSGDWECDEFQSELELDNILDELKFSFKKKYPSFDEPEHHYSRDAGRERYVILESPLFFLCTEDNQHSVAVELIQKEDPYDYHLIGLQKRHYKRYLRSIAEILLQYLPALGTYKGAWQSGRLTSSELDSYDW